MEIVPGLHRLRTPMTSDALPWVMPYAFEGADGVSLFDSGYGTPEAIAALREQLAGLGYQPRQVRRLIVSHAHPDHLGMAGWVKEQAPDAELVMTAREWDWRRQIQGGPESWVERTRGWLARHGVPLAEIEEERDRADRDGHHDVAEETARRSWSMSMVEPDVLVEDGELLEFDGWRLRAVWTPGHTPGHLCGYVEGHGLMLTGDHVLSRITPNVSLSTEDEESGRSPLGEFLDSLDKVAAFDTTRALPAHEDLIDDLPARCAALRAHHDHRMQEVYDGIAGGMATASEISSRVTWNRPYETFSMFKKRSALGETLAHLQLLLDRGRVRRVEGEDVVLWERC